MTTTCDSDGDPYLELLSKAAKALENAAIPSQLKDRLLTPVTGGTAKVVPGAIKAFWGVTSIVLNTLALDDPEASSPTLAYWTTLISLVCRGTKFGKDVFFVDNACHNANQGSPCNLDCVTTGCASLIVSHLAWPYKHQKMENFEGEFMRSCVQVSPILPPLFKRMDPQTHVRYIPKNLPSAQPFLLVSRSDDGLRSMMKEVLIRRKHQEGMQIRNPSPIVLGLCISKGGNQAQICVGWADGAAEPQIVALSEQNSACHLTTLHEIETLSGLILGALSACALEHKAEPSVGIDLDYCTSATTELSPYEAEGGSWLHERLVLRSPILPDAYDTSFFAWPDQMSQVHLTLYNRFTKDKSTERLISQILSTSCLPEYVVRNRKKVDIMQSNDIEGGSDDDDVLKALDKNHLASVLLICSSQCFSRSWFAIDNDKMLPQEGRSVWDALLYQAQYAISDQRHHLHIILQPQLAVPENTFFGTFLPNARLTPCAVTAIISDHIPSNQENPTDKLQITHSQMVEQRWEWELTRCSDFHNQLGRNTAEGVTTVVATLNQEEDFLKCDAILVSSVDIALENQEMKVIISHFNAGLQVSQKIRPQVPVPATSQERNPDSSSQLLLLPSLVCVYRKRSESLWAAETRLRKAVVCAVKYLSAIGIHDRPVYGMITDGSYAAVIFAFEKPEGVVMLFDSHVKVYDISVPQQALNSI